MKLTKQIALYLLPEHVRKLDDLVRSGLYPSRAEAIRVAITDLLRIEAKWTFEVSERLKHQIETPRTLDRR